MNDASDTTAFAAFLSQRGRLDEGALLTDGDEIDGWRVLGFLGRGGNGEVYRVRRTENDAFAALKILCRDEPAARRRFALEEEVLSREREAALPSLLATGEHGGRPYFVMELLEPVEVPREESAIARYLLEVCAAVTTLHARGLVHRDIKPTNIMRRTDGRLVLIDVGLAKEETELPRPREGISLVAGAAVGVGTPGYAAPEQFQGGRVSPLADIHALGRLAHAAFGGNPPRCWVSIIRRATSSIPEQRFGSVEELEWAIRGRNRTRRIVCVLCVGLLLLGCLYGALTVWWQMYREWQEECSLCAPDPEIDGGIVIRLDTRSAAPKNPLTLEAGRHYRVIGPGLLKAEFVSKGGTAVLCVTNCMVYNLSSVPLAQAGIRYVLEGGAFLSFPNLADPEKPLPSSIFEERGKFPKTFSNLVTFSNSVKLTTFQVK